MNLSNLRSAGRRLLRPLVVLLAGMGVKPAALTLSGLVVTAIAGWLVWRGSFVVGSLVLALGSVLDAVDGAIARWTGSESSAGAVLDSFVDRVGEAVVFTAILAGEAGRGRPAMLYIVPIALVGSYMVSYVRARAEGEGVDCTVGVFTRTERLVVLVFGLFLGGILSPDFVVYGVIVVAAGAWLTALQRLRTVITGTSAGK
ncbi:CDP-alcohol phosphatidyltransferase family protein [Candidatus Fermentibacteria bacterium]|nr:CDP-alcohol phosphatidyltransferase family protein [Candidatus Fermentibacteria bacterium]